jgi:hypothetical protein
MNSFPFPPTTLNDETAFFSRLNHLGYSRKIRSGQNPDLDIKASAQLVDVFQNLLADHKKILFTTQVNQDTPGVLPHTHSFSILRKSPVSLKLKTRDREMPIHRFDNHDLLATTQLNLDTGTGLCTDGFKKLKLNRMILPWQRTLFKNRDPLNMSILHLWQSAVHQNALAHVITAQSVSKTYPLHGSQSPRHIQTALSKFATIINRCANC